jgi:uncharacterized protein YjbI with pentapeptide repeats
MPKPLLRRFRWIAVALAVVIAAVTLPRAVFWLERSPIREIAWLRERLSPPWDSQAIIVIAIEATLALLAGIWWLWWWVPKWQMKSVTAAEPKARADIEDNFRKTVGQALGGAAVLIAAGAAYLQFSQQQQAVHDLLISNQVSKGFEQMGSKELVIRLGGIYALEGVMNTSEQYHQPVLEALCAFVRNGTTVARDGTAIKVSDKPTTDIQAALTVIGRRTDGPGEVELSGATLIGANLGHANLTGANLLGANLSRAFLVDATLSNAFLRNSNLGYAILSSAKLTDAFLVDSTLSNANLSYATLDGAFLERANLTGAFLVFANLTGAHLFGASLTGAFLDGATLDGAFLDGATLTGAHLLGARNLTQSQLDGACGTDAQLPPSLTLKPCPEPTPVAPTLNPR